MMNSDRRSQEVIRQEIEASFISGGGKVLKPDWFEVVEHPGSVEGSIVVTVDLAGFAKQRDKKVLRTDESVIAVTLITPECWYVLNILHGHWDVRETALNIVKTSSGYYGARLGIEQGALANAVGPYLDDYMREFNRYITPEPLRHGNTKKTDRIVWGLQGRAERGKIKLVKAAWNEWFLDQVADFPDPLAHDDGLDAVAYVDQMASVDYSNDIDIEDWEPLDLESGY
jgi:phage terminase large subunit-like protein